MLQEAEPADDPNELLNCSYIQKLCTESIKVLRRIFRQRWSDYSSLNPLTTQWVNGDAHGQQLLQLFKPPEYMKNILKKGNIDKWDVSALCAAINAVSKATYELVKSDPFKTSHNYESEDKFIKDIKETRNQLAHRASSKFSDDEFTELWHKLDDALIGLGEQPANLEKIKNLYSSGVQNNFDKEAADLKAQADKCFQDKKYGEAISIYKKILKLESVKTEDQPVIYSNISGCYLLLDTPESIKKAVGYAKQCVTMRPTWWRGYYRLGRAQFELGKLEKAKTSLTTALALKPSSEQEQIEISNVQHELGKQIRQDDLQRATHTQEEEYKMVSNRLGMSVDYIESNMEEFKKIPTMDDILHGHYYRDGTHGVKQDYAKAATYYAKAADGGNPEGMHNLALLYANGLGVKRDHKTSLMWLKKAAEMPVNTVFGKLGIAEAQHSLGLRYQNGVGAPKDLKLAVEWYQRAVENNCGASANNLALLYQTGTGVERSLKTAFMHLKMGAQQNDVPAMLNLADCYFGAHGTGSLTPLNEDIQLGIVWLERAAALGNLEASNKLEQLRQSPMTIIELVDQSMTAFLPPEADPLNYEEHFNVVSERAMQGSVTAARVLEIWVAVKSAMIAFQNNDHPTLVAELSAAIHLDHNNVRIPELFHDAIYDRMISHPDELEVNVCYIHIKTHETTRGENATRGRKEEEISILKKFPHDSFFFEVVIIGLIFQGEFKKALELVELGLQLYETLSDTFYYIQGLIYLRKDKLSRRDREEMNKSFDAFLAVAAEDHPQVPFAHYGKAYYHLGNLDHQHFIACYEGGLAAEAQLLPCFLPLFIPLKSELEKVYSMSKAKSVTCSAKNEFADLKSGPKMLTVNLVNGENSDGENSDGENSDGESSDGEIKLTVKIRTVKRSAPVIKGSLSNKLLFSDPHRRNLLVKSRQIFADMEDNNGLLTPVTSATPILLAQTPSLVSLNPITLEDIDATKDHVYDGYVLQLKVINWPHTIKAVFLQVADKKGSVQKLAIYNWPNIADKQKLMRTFSPNRTLSLINPHMRIALDGESLLHVQSPAYIVLGTAPPFSESCHCCGAQGKTTRCSRCKLARYCSKQCQKHDWTDFGHKIVCQKLKKYSKMFE